MESKDGEPTVDVEFFNALRSVFENYPDAARKYSIRSRHDELDKLKIDFSKQRGVSRIEGNRIVTEFKNISEVMASTGGCCERYLSGGRWHCARWCVV